MVLNIIYRLPNGEDKTVGAVIDEDTSKIYLEKEWQAYSLYELLKDERYGEFLRLGISRR